MANRTRNIQLNFRVTEKERALIEQKMDELGTTNTEAFLRKMAIDGYILSLDLTGVKGMISLLRRMSNNLNQIAKRMNENGQIYEIDLEDVRLNQERLWAGLNDLLTRLGSL